MSEVKQLISLIHYSGFFNFEALEDDWVSIVSISRNHKLPTHAIFNPDDNSATDEDDNTIETPSEDDLESTDDIKIHSVYLEMNKKYELQKVRAQCMQLLTLMPAEIRKSFIER